MPSFLSREDFSLFFPRRLASNCAYPRCQELLTIESFFIFANKVNVRPTWGSNPGLKQVQFEVYHLNHRGDRLYPHVLRIKCSQEQIIMGKSACHCGRPWSKIWPNYFHVQYVGCSRVWCIPIPTTRSRNVCRTLNALSESRRRYPISPPSTTTSTNNTDNQHADAQYEPKPGCWGAVCGGRCGLVSLATFINSNCAFTKKDKQTQNSARMDFVEGKNKYQFVKLSL